MNESAVEPREYDVIVVGSGAGGMTAALCAQAQGLSALVIEKQDVYGGTSAVSGGGIWIPCNEDIPRVGGNDSYDEALTYLKGLIGEAVPQRRIEAYLRNAPAMVRFLRERFGVGFRAVKKYPDYFPDHPGGKPGYRTMEPVDFDARRLGAEFERLRGPYQGTQLMGRISMDQVEAHVLFTRGPGWIWLMLRMMGRYWFDFAWRRRTRRDRRLVLGQGLVGSLRHAMQEHKVPLWLETGFDSLVVENGRVGGVDVTRRGQKLRLKARRGVILASGGFEANQQMREQYLPKPTSAQWSAAPPINPGDGIRAGQALGAATAFMDLTWGSPTVVTGKGPACGIFVERALPGSVVVNKQGRRFVNEACPYTEFVYAMHAEQARSGGGVPCWLVFDATFRKKYPMGPLLPGQIQPDSALPRHWLDQVYYRADTLDALAAKIGVDAAGLKDTVRQMGEFAAQGQDPQFKRGGNVFERYYSDPSVKPNPCLGPIVKAPFYAARLDAGELGTKGGLLTDEAARVLRSDGSVIEGLYAIGNCSAAVMGRTYAGPGATLGPAMTFAYVAAQEIAKTAAPRAAQAGVAAAA
ncbi:MAG: FAD-dependent oxidoreductase [Nevskia sp.]|nr:FAD-dependent oxidoreductase [Nevskia sp.]